MSDIPGKAAEWLDKALYLFERMFGWGVLGAICGLLPGFANEHAHTPPEVPGEPLANEWGLVAVMNYMFIEAIAGMILGVGIALLGSTPSRRRRAFVLALSGAFLGFVVGCVFTLGLRIVNPMMNDEARRAVTFAMQAGGIAGGLLLATPTFDALDDPPRKSTTGNPSSNDADSAV